MICLSAGADEPVRKKFAPLEKKKDNNSPVVGETSNSRNLVFQMISGAHPFVIKNTSDDVALEHV